MFVEVIKHPGVNNIRWTVKFEKAWTDLAHMIAAVICGSQIAPDHSNRDRFRRCPDLTIQQWISPARSEMGKSNLGSLARACSSSVLLLSLSLSPSRGRTHLISFLVPGTWWAICFCARVYLCTYIVLMKNHSEGLNAESGILDVYSQVRKSYFWTV